MLKDRTWLTENTEIYTVNGWLPIIYINKVREVVSYNSVTNKIESSNIKSFNIREYSGDIPTAKYGKQQAQGFIEYYENSIWTPLGNNPLPITSNIPYSGKLFNIVTSNNTFFVRTVFNDQDNQDYILCQSVK